MAERKARRFRGTFVGASVIPIFPGLARVLSMDGADLRRLNEGTHPVLVSHEQDYEAQVGRVVSAKAERGGVKGEIEIFANAPEDVHMALDNGMRNVSIGFRPIENEMVDTDMGTVIRSKIWEADEVSLVAVGASREARMTEEQIDGEWKG